MPNDTPNDSQIAALESAAAQARELADAARNRKLWEGDYSKRIAAIRESLDRASRGWR